MRLLFHTFDVLFAKSFRAPTTKLLFSCRYLFFPRFASWPSNCPLLLGCKAPVYVFNLVVKYKPLEIQKAEY